MSSGAQVAVDGPAVALLQPQPVSSLDLGSATSPRSYHASMPGYRPTALRSAPVAAAR